LNKWHQAKKPYPLKNPQKYIGDPSKLLYKSSWEERAFYVCDNNPNVLEWGYEIIDIPYIAPTRNGGQRNRVYKPDLYVVTQNNGVVKKKLIEIKPYKQTVKPRSRKPRTRLYEEHTFIINELKWSAAKQWCKARNIEFVLSTEREMFGNRSKRQ
jgi:hypothetical protein